VQGEKGNNAHHSAMLCHCCVCLQQRQHVTVQFLFLGASNNQQAGLYRQQPQLLSEQHHSSTGGEWWQRASLGHVVPVLHSFNDNSSSIMTVQFLFFDASGNQTFTGGSCSSCLKSFQFSAKAAQREGGGNLSHYAIAWRKLFLYARQSTRTINRSDN